MLLAITSGLAPGSAAVTKMAGKSMRGSGATGSSVKAAAPEQAMPSVRRIVATGRLMNGAEMFMLNDPRDSRRGVRELALAGRLRAPREALREPVEREIDHRRRIEREQLAHEKAPDDTHPERMAQLRARAGTEHQRQCAENRRHRRHEDRPKAQQARLMDRLERRQSLRAHGID